jgi:hypothetical protein
MRRGIDSAGAVQWTNADGRLESPPSAVIAGRLDLPRTTRPASISADTSRDAHEAQIQPYRRMGGAARVAVMFRLSEAARRWSIAGIRHRHPHYDAFQLASFCRG